MKNDSDDFKVIFGHVELDQARFSYGDDMGLDFQNEIDAWSKMEVIFRQQIKHLKDSKTLKRKAHARNSIDRKSDLKTLIYSFRDKVD